MRVSNPTNSHYSFTVAGTNYVLPPKNHIDVADDLYDEFIAITNNLYPDIKVSFIEQVLPKFFDVSVNMGKTYFNYKSQLVLETPKRNTGQVAGNFFGGGTGNKPMFGIVGWEGKHITELPKLMADVEIWTRATVTDADERQDGLSFNVLIDLNGNNNPADFKVMSITAALNAVTDTYGKFGLSASITDFDIGAFEQLAVARQNGNPPAAYSSGEKAPFLKNHFYIVGGLSTYVIGTNVRNHSTIDNTWPGIPMSLDVLLNGGTMPMTGAQFTSGYPNCKLVGGVVSFDGGHPAQIKLPSILGQIGDSSLALRSITCVKTLTIDGVNLFPNFGY